MERLARFRHFFSRRLRKSGVLPEARVRPDGAQQGEPRDGRVRPGGRAGPEGRVVAGCYEAAWEFANRVALGGPSRI